MLLDTNETKTSSLYYVPLMLTESLLPYRGHHTHFTRKYQDTHITIQGGADDTGPLPLPSGVLGRRLLFHFITEAWLKRSSKIKIAGTQTILRDLNIKPSNAQRRALKKQIYYLSQMTIRVKTHFTLKDEKYEAYKGENIRVLKGLQIYNTDHPTQLTLFDSWIEFSPEFYELLLQLRKKHPPIAKEPVWKLTGALQMDLYCFLQRRLQNIELSFSNTGFTLTWEALYEQFGRGERPQDFRKMIKSALKKVVPVIKTHRAKFADNTPVRVIKSGLRLYHIPRQVEEVSRDRAGRIRNKTI